MDEQKRRQIRAYFARFPRWTIAAAAVGLVIIVAADGVMGYAAGIGAVLLGVAMGVRWRTSRPSDAQMDLWFQEDLKGIEPRALTKGSLDVSDLVRDQVSIVGPGFRNLSGAEFGFRKGSDGRARFRT
ncbi:MAG: hypothetical protein WAM82_16080 [Thermoanaerobaculia bacterium]